MVGHKPNSPLRKDSLCISKNLVEIEIEIELKLFFEWSMHKNE